MNNIQNINSFLNALLLEAPSQTDLSNNNISITDLSNNNLFSLIDMIHDVLPQQPSNIQNVLQTTLNQKNCYKDVLSDEGKQQIKFLTYKKGDFEEKKCAILQVPFEDDETIAQLPCGHIFNKDSILQWLEEESNKCPVCRYELESKEKKIIVEHMNHPYGPTNRRIGFTDFLNNYYEAQEDRMVQRAIEQSLLDLNQTDSETEILLSDVDDLI